MTRIKSAASVLVILFAALLLGCGSEKIHDLSGTITFKGKPVPAGHIVFEPDTSAGNSGAAGFATIKGGQYDTRIFEGRGTVGGPHHVRILGLDGVPRGELLNGMPVFPEYSTTADLPKEDATQDFEVRRSAGVGSGKQFNLGPRAK
jgi:hypothetical protein